MPVLVVSVNPLCIELASIHKLTYTTLDLMRDIFLFSRITLFGILAASIQFWMPSIFAPWDSTLYGINLSLIIFNIVGGCFPLPDNFVTPISSGCSNILDIRSIIR